MGVVLPVREDMTARSDGRKTLSFFLVQKGRIKEKSQRPDLSRRHPLRVDGDSDPDVECRGSRHVVGPDLRSQPRRIQTERNPRCV